MRDMVSPSDPELVEKTLARLAEQDHWNDLFSTKLIELLDKIDQIKGEIRDRIRRADERIQKAESVTQAESRLLEEAAKFGGASERLEMAQAAEGRASEHAVEAKSNWENASTALANALQMADTARGLAEDASRKLLSAQERESEMARMVRLTAGWACVAVALSWLAMGWTAWFVLRTR